LVICSRHGSKVETQLDGSGASLRSRKAAITCSSGKAAARAIWFAVQQPSKPVAVKTEMQQAMLALHRARQQLVAFRTMQINGLRGMLAEFGEVMVNTRAGIVRAIPEVLARVPVQNCVRPWINPDGGTTDGCPHPTMGARFSERTLWRLHGEIAAHGNAVPNVMQHALCPSRKRCCLTGCKQPVSGLCQKISDVTETLRTSD
jgi:hypothetical protein